MRLCSGLLAQGQVHSLDEASGDLARIDVRRLSIDHTFAHRDEPTSFRVLADLAGQPQAGGKGEEHRFRPGGDARFYPVSEILYARGAILSRTDFKKASYRGGGWRVRERDTRYYHQDVLGSTVMLTDAKGHLWGRFAYDAFGGLYEGRKHPWGDREESPQEATSQLYTGKRYDAAAGLYDYGFRDCRPQLGRWTSVDPIRNGDNWCMFCHSDPVNWLDSLGLTPTEIAGTGKVEDSTAPLAQAASPPTRKGCSMHFRKERATVYIWSDP